jgi:hypothetical protein
MRTRQQGLTLFMAILWLVATVVVIQLWLVAAALDALLAGAVAILVPAAVASLLLFLLNYGLLRFVLRFDRRLRASLVEADQNRPAADTSGRRSARSHGDLG